MHIFSHDYCEDVKLLKQAAKQFKNNDRAGDGSWLENNKMHFEKKVCAADNFSLPLR